jgi:hypothetical protein
VRVEAGPVADMAALRLVPDALGRMSEAHRAEIRAGPATVLASPEMSARPSRPERVRGSRAVTSSRD